MVDGRGTPRLQQLTPRLCRADELPARGGAPILRALPKSRIEFIDAWGRPCAANGARGLHALALVQALRGGAYSAVGLRVSEACTARRVNTPTNRLYVQ